jgi:hypothetical protein
MLADNARKIDVGRAKAEVARQERRAAEAEEAAHARRQAEGEAATSSPWAIARMGAQDRSRGGRYEE